MKLSLLTYVLLSLLSTCMAAQLDITRTAFFQATNDEGIKTFLAKANALNDDYITHKAYKGAASAMSAGIASSVSDKLSRFNEGKKLLEEAVTKDWYNSEIRFLRFAIQSETPFFLGYSGNVEDDIQVIVDALEQKKINHSTDYWKKAIAFILKSDALKSKHRTVLTKYQSA